MTSLYIDTGGTFTDTLAVNGQGEWRRLKVLSSSASRLSCAGVDGLSVLVAKFPVSDPACLVGYTLGLLGAASTALIVGVSEERACLELAEKLPGLEAGGVLEIRSTEQAPVFAARLITGTPPDRPLPPLSMRLATTKGTNALLERKGVPPVLYTNRGFADLPEIGTQQRDDLFALHVRRAKPLHGRVVEVDVRLAADGAVISDFPDWTAAAPADWPPQPGQPAAVAFVNSYANPVHENQMGEWLRGQGVEFVSESARLAPLIRLLPRMQTAIVDAYLSPVLDRYLNEVEAAVGQGRVLVMHSAGGLEEREDYRAKDSLLSGPAAGVKGVQAVGQMLGHERAIGFDMGGTSTDVCRVDGSPDMAFEHRIGDTTVFAPMLAIETVAAGGGSICGIRNGELFVGPESAGAHPGPACYGAGGPLTLTDVNLLLGRLSEDGFGIPIDIRHSHKALEAIAREWRQDPDHLLEAWLRLADERMAEAIRRISVRKGYDPSEYALVSFGGAGGQHACSVARLLDIHTVIFPADAGLLSAWGLRHAHRERITERQVLLTLEEGFATLPAILKEAATEGWELAEVRLGLRFKGLDTVEWLTWDEASDLKLQYLDQFRRVYGFLPERPVELESVRIRSRQRSSALDVPPSVRETADGDSILVEKRQVHGRWMEVPVVNRSAMPEGVHEGPLLVLDPYSTSWIEPGWVVEVDAQGNLIAKGRQAEGREGAPVEATSSDLARLSLDASRLQAVALEMGEQLQRTALSVNVKERLDFSCAVLDAHGYLVVNAPHIPVHLGALGMCVRAVMQELEMEPGDVVVTNHPAYGGSHLPDVTVISPVYADDGSRLGFVANRAHHAEIGGKRPGSMPPDARNLAEEGVVIPPMHLFKGGEPRWDVLEQVFRAARYPSRNFAENQADLLAAIAANRLGQNRLMALASQLGADRLRESMARLRSFAASRMQAEVSTWGWAERSSRETLDDGSVLAVTIRRDGGRLTIDFAGTSAVHPGNLNATPAIVHSATMYVLRTLVDDELPLNEGLMDGVEVVIPESLLNPRFERDPERCPAVVGGNVEVSQRLVDTMLKPFERVACSQGTMNNLLFGNERFGYYETICGGTGAGPGFSGTDGVHHHMTNTRITDVEVMEWRYPVRVEAFGFRRGSGGPGRWRGGHGVARKLRFLEEVDLSLLSQHRVSGAYGLRGGGDGSPGRQWVERADGTLQSLGGVDAARLHAGDAVVIETPGGGGWGGEGEGGEDKGGKE